jgi:hypothetical protein
MKKKVFLAVHDYKKGGIWLLIRARSVEEILNKYPELEVVETRPQWMTKEIFDKITQNMNFDIDDEPSGFLLDLVRDRNAGV